MEITLAQYKEAGSAYYRTSNHSSANSIANQWNRTHFCLYQSVIVNHVLVAISSCTLSC